MAIYIEIKKQKSEKNNIVYFVKTELSGSCEFCVQVFPDTNKLVFYKDDKFAKKLGTVDLTDVEKKVEIREIAPSVYGRVIIQILKALKRNEFSPRLDYTA